MGYERDCSSWQMFLIGIYCTHFKKCLNGYDLDFVAFSNSRT